MVKENKRTGSEHEELAPSKRDKEEQRQYILNHKIENKQTP